MASLEQVNVALGSACQAMKSETDEPTRRGLWAAYLTLLIDHLAAQGVKPEYLAPLAELREQKLGRTQPDEERRTGGPASDELLARACAVIDLLVKVGISEEEAARKVTRQLLAAGLLPPSEGGDARGWKRLLLWWTRLHRGLGSESAKAGYLRCREEIESIPAHERVERALRERLWDRRRSEIQARRAS